MLDPEIRTHYDLGVEAQRLAGDGESLELLRTRELLQRFLPAPPAALLDVGGGPGIYAAWLAQRSYTVRLLDPVPLHVQQASAASAAQPDRPFSVTLGDARHLDEPSGTYDAVLLMGPLYHLIERTERLAALGEARRVLRPSGRLLAVGISRFASLLDGLRTNALADPRFAAIVERDLREGQHRNPDPKGRPEWFTTAYFHHPDDLRSEIADAGFHLEAILGIEGPSWLFEHRPPNPQHLQTLLQAARVAEQEPTLMGLSAHLLAVATPQ